LAPALLPIAWIACGRRADEHQARVAAGLREVLVLGQEAVARVHASAPLWRAAAMMAGMFR
jgi:hypothetical protein